MTIFPIWFSFQGFRPSSRATTARRSFFGAASAIVERIAADEERAAFSAADRDH
jgi:hypothetical protein